MSGTPGRPLSAELSEQLLAVAVDILADEGWGRLNSDRVAARARAVQRSVRARRSPRMLPVSSGGVTSRKRPTAARASAAIVGQRR